MKINDKNGVLKVDETISSLLEELAQEANGPELEKAGELDNEATLEKAPKELTSDIDNKDVYGDDEEAAEDVGEVVVEAYTDLELMEYLNENGYEPSLENLLILKEKLMNEDELETNPLEKEAEEAGVASDEKAETGDVKEDSEDKEEEKKEEDSEDKEEEKEQTNENALFDFINSINESLAQEANGPELDGEGELKNEATEEKEAKTEKADTDNEDVYCDDCHKQVEDVVEVVVEAVVACKANGVPATLENITEAVESLLIERRVTFYENLDLSYPSYEEFMNEAWTPEKEVKKSASGEVSGWKNFLAWFIAGIPGIILAHLLKINRKSGTKFNYDELADAISHDQEGKRILDELRNAMNEQNKAKMKELKSQFKNRLEIVKRELKYNKSGKLALAEGFFDIDAFIMSKEMNGSKKFDEYEKIEGEGANAALTGLRETKSYKSLKEACMMGDGYFTEDSYTVETAAEKTAKLTEQVSLLIARENNDPLYDELLKESAYCMRLREQIQNKYNRSAIAKVNDITK